MIKRCPKEKDKIPDSTIPVTEYRTNYLSGWRKKPKYNNTKATYNGNKYDSKLECKVAQELDFRIDAGELVEVKRQVRVPLYVNNVLICNYYLDFMTTDKHGEVTYIEVKGFETKDWILKKKLFLALLPGIHPGAKYEIIKK
jgi:hypothetical protein